MEKKLSVGQQSLLGYLPATIIKNILDGDIDINKKFPQCYKTNTVALFADISGFTKLSEVFSKKGRIGPEFLTFCLNRYMEQLINIIGKNGGDIFKFAGDAIIVIWPPELSGELQSSCRRAIQCAMDIQLKLNNQEISPGKTLSVKIGIGVGECRILVVGGLFKRCEYLSIGEALRQACESETMATVGGQSIVSEYVKLLVDDFFQFELAEGGHHDSHQAEGTMKYYLIKSSTKEKLSTKAEAYLMRTKFNSESLREKHNYFKSFVPAAITSYLEIEKESWSKEIRMLTTMFLNIKVDLSQTSSDSGLERLQQIVRDVQRSIYRTKGSLNKFLMDDKGSVMLICWGLPPLSAPDDQVRAVLSAKTLIKELKKYNCPAFIGITTGTCFTGVCGTIGNRREYSLLGEVVNLSARFMGKAKDYAVSNSLDEIILLDEITKNFIQNKICCEHVFTTQLKGFSTDFHFYKPIDEASIQPNVYNPFPQIKTHNNNSYQSRHKKPTGSEVEDYNRSVQMIGRKREMNLCLCMMNEAYLKNEKKIIVVKGLYGSGKSLFIRRCLHEFLNRNKEIQKAHSDTFSSSSLKFIFASFQTTTMANCPFNAFGGILREMYHTLVGKKLCGEMISRRTKQGEIVCDEIGEILIETDTVGMITAINEVLSHEEKTEINYSLHFDNISALNFKNQGLKSRDAFFEERKYVEKAEEEKLINFFTQLIQMYQRALANNFSTQQPPIIFVIEDTHMIDVYSINLIRAIRDRDELSSLVMILSYQIPFSNIFKNDRDKMSKASDLLGDNETNEESKTTFVQVLMDNITEMKDIQELITLYFYDIIYEEYKTSIERVDQEMMRIILKKSFGGVPLFILDIVESMINSKKYVQILSGELVITSELLDMEAMCDWADFKVPYRLEKILGGVIDSLSTKEIILLKHAAVIGVMFDIDKLHQFNPFSSISFNELYLLLHNLEQNGIIEFLHDLSPKHKDLICKFSIPFLREILYQRMLIEQRNDIHLYVARSLQMSQFKYMAHKIEVKLLEHHLKTSERSIVKQIEEDDDSIKQENGMIHVKKKKNELNLNNLKIFLVKEICERLKSIKEKTENPNEPSLDKEEHLNYHNHSKKAIRSGFIEKKSDGKITWEYRYCVVTSTRVSYYYQEKEFLENKMPLAMFMLKNLYDIQILNDNQIGGKTNIFSIQVSSWYKKDILRGPRKYIFSCRSREDLYTWIITLNFLRVKVTYDEFSNQFGLLQLPLRHEIKVRKKKEQRKFYLQEPTQPMNKTKVKSVNIYSSIARKSMVNRKSAVSNDTKKNSYSSKVGMFPFQQDVNYFEENVVKVTRNKKTVEDVISAALLIFLGYIQENVFYSANNFGINKAVPTPEHVKVALVDISDDYEEETSNNQTRNNESLFLRDKLEISDVSEKNLIYKADNISREFEPRSENTPQKNSMEFRIKSSITLSEQVSPDKEESMPQPVRPVNSFRQPKNNIKNSNKSDRSNRSGRSERVQTIKNEQTIQNTEGKHMNSEQNEALFTLENMINKNESNHLLLKESANESWQLNLTNSEGNIKFHQKNKLEDVKDKDSFEIIQETNKYNPAVNILKNINLSLSGDEEEFLNCSNNLITQDQIPTTDKQKIHISLYSSQNLFQQEESFSKYDLPQYEYLKNENTDEIYKNVYFSSLLKKVLK